MTDDETKAVGDLAMRALDTMSDYGADVKLRCASIVFEVYDPATELFHSNYCSLEDSSPNHVGGLLIGAGQRILSPATDVEDD